MNSNAIIYESNDSLQHYGVLGMRWGHHKSQPKVSRYERKKSKYTNELQTKISKQKKSNPKRSTKDTASLVLRRESRENTRRKEKRTLATTALSGAGWATGMGLMMAGPSSLPFFAPFVTSAVGMITPQVYNAGKTFSERYKDMAIADLYDEYNIPNSKRNTVL